MFILRMNQAKIANHQQLLENFLTLSPFWACSRPKNKRQRKRGCKRYQEQRLVVWAHMMHIIGLKVLDPALYFLKALLLIINIVQMGKKLRNREILTQTDHEEEDQAEGLPHLETIAYSAIRKNLKESLRLRRGPKIPNINTFRKRCSSHQFSEIVTPSRFQCPICLELMVTPVAMTCGHAYCLRCLDSNTAYSERCCLCRHQQRAQPPIPLKFAETLIERFLVPSGSEFIRYLCRTTDSAEWLKRRQIASYKLGLVVDFQDRCNIWRRGVIVNVLNNDRIQIKTNVKGMNLFETVDKKSKRLAPYTFFTRSRYLEDFPPSLPEHDPTQNSLSKLEYLQNWEGEEDGSFVFPEEGDSAIEGYMGEPVEEFQDQALRIFNSEMNEIDSILNI